MLSYVFAGRGSLENTSFALLDSEGRKITRGSRSPQMTYGSSDRFAAALKETAKPFLSKAKAIETLPTLRNLRLALNVAAADMRPLVIIRGKDKEQAASLAKNVASLAWSKDAIGKSHYVVIAEEATFEGLTPALGVTVVAPDPYGMGGKVLVHATPKLSKNDLAKALKEGIAKYKPEAREFDDHVRTARKKGIKWETAVPVTDKDALRERRR